MLGVVECSMVVGNKVIEQEGIKHWQGLTYA